MSSYPSCLQDERFLLEFFICHPSNSRINAINQRYWLQYHTLSELQSPLSSTDIHLIHPSNTSVDYTQHHKLCPFWKWLNLTHLNTFIHGPFEFASVNPSMAGKTRDCVSQADLDILTSHLNMSLTHFRGSMFPQIQFTLTAARTYLVTMLPYFANWSCQHPTLEVPQVVGTLTDGYLRTSPLH
jgi:hypothetical protein